MHQIAPFGQRTELQRFFLFSGVTYHTGLDQRVSFQFFRHCETFGIFFPKWSPFNFFMVFCDRMDVQKPQRAPFQFFWHCETFFENLFFLQRVPPATATKILTISEVSPISEPGARASGARRATR